MKSTNIQIIEAYKRHLDLGLNVGSEGNISVRKNDLIYITPSGIDINKIGKKHISVISLDGFKENKIKPSSELDLHLMLYKNRAEISSIVHCHSDWASTLSCLRKNIPQFHYMVAEFGGKDIKCAKYATFGTKKLAKNVIKAIKNRKGCLLANHGQICVGKNLEEASHLSIALEKISKQYFFCLLSKKFKMLTNNEMSEVLESFSDYKTKR
ncbi:MAG: class II aldolase/adducin family protein [Pseudomonadota bacterium]|nr:class II aldolase/adducin family protein [Pseudomonadota bacterium]